MAVEGDTVRICLNSVLALVHFLGLKSIQEDICLEDTYSANSSRAEVAFGAFSFWIKRILRGGEGHCKESRSWP